MFNDTVAEVNVKILTVKQLSAILESSGFLEPGMILTNWGEYEAIYHQHIYLAMFDDPHHAEGRFIITEVYIDLGVDGKIHADYAACPIGSFHQRKNADVVYSLAQEEYILPRSLRHKHIP